MVAEISPSACRISALFCCHSARTPGSAQYKPYHTQGKPYHALGSKTHAGVSSTTTTAGVLGGFFPKQPTCTPNLWLMPVLQWCPGGQEAPCRATTLQRCCTSSLLW